MLNKPKTMLRFRRFSLILLSSVFFNACIKDSNPDIPAYIYVPNIRFQSVDSIIEGSSSHKITNAWVSIDGQLIGINEFPFLMPGIISDTSVRQRVRVFAGIDANGIASSKALYPFFDPFEVELDLKQGKIDTLFAVLSYKPDVKFIIIEDFENPGVVFGNDIDQFPNSRLIKQSNEVFEGLYSGQIELDSLNPECYISTTFRYSNLQRPNTASPVYLELHYKTNIPVSIGLIAHRSIGSDEVFMKGGVNAIEGWNKIYFELTNDIYGLNADEYSVYLRTTLTGTGINDAKIYFDNIKIVHF
jgi:hypothetical protein